MNTYLVVIETVYAPDDICLMHAACKEDIKNAYDGISSAVVEITKVRIKPGIKLEQPEDM
ncbi:MAG: hypothetical protein VX100_07375 [Pseudomonadota bacterium]|nr:hypothetical protein [Pseudomonadota bacterium]